LLVVFMSSSKDVETRKAKEALMVRRFISTVALVACAGVYALAATERATFILTNGERKSGTIVFHGGSHENLIAGDLNLGQDNAKDLTFPMDQVAVIDFVGGRPAREEISTVPASGHFLVMRDGNSQPGTFVNMIGGDTLLWRNQSGTEQRFPLRDVRRIYLNPDSARTAFRFRGTGANAVGTAGQTVLAPGAVAVQANQPWTDTGVDVKVGDLVRFQASGQVAFGQGETQIAGADGKGDTRSPNYPVPAMPVGGVIAKVGNMAPFPIGSNQQPIRMPASGRLMLGVNDNEVGDNSGFFSVVVTKTGQNR
jgi:hypothetical protein